MSVAPTLTAMLAKQQIVVGEKTFLDVIATDADLVPVVEAVEVTLSGKSPDGRLVIDPFVATAQLVTGSRAERVDVTVACLDGAVTVAATATPTRFELTGAAAKAGTVLVTARDEAGNSVQRSVAITVTAPVSTKRFAGDPGPGRMYLGCSGDNYLSVEAGSPLGVHVTYYKGGPYSGAVSTVKADQAAKRMPSVSFKPTGGYIGLGASTTKQTAYRAELDVFFKAVAALGPVFATIQHEPENDGDGMNPEPTQAALIADWTISQRIAREARDAAGAKNVTLVANLMSWTYRTGSDRPWADWGKAAALHNDIVTVNHYNKSTSDKGFAGAEFKAILDRLKQSTGGKPMGIREAGCTSAKGLAYWTAEWKAFLDMCRAYELVFVSAFSSTANSTESWVITPEQIPLFNAWRAEPWSARYPGLG